MITATGVGVGLSYKQYSEGWWSRGGMICLPNKPELLQVKRLKDLFNQWGQSNSRSIESNKPAIINI